MINDHSGPLGGGARRARPTRRSCTPCTARSTAISAANYRAIADARPERRAHLALDEPAPARGPIFPGSRTARTRSTSTRIPSTETAATTSSSSGRMSAGQGRTPGDRGRARGRASRSSSPGKKREPPSRSTSTSTCARSSATDVEYLGETSHDDEGRAAPERARDALPDRLGGAVRPRHDRVDGLRHAGDRHAPRRRAGGGRARAESGIIVDDYAEMVGAIAEADRSTRRVPAYVEERSRARMVATTSPLTRRSPVAETGRPELVAP